MGKRLPKGPNGRKIRRATAMKAAALITRQTRKVPNVGDIRGLLGPGRECSTAKPVAIILDALRRRADGADAHAPFVDGWLGLVHRWSLPTPEAAWTGLLLFVIRQFVAGVCLVGGGGGRR